jgi:hypothetical protein
MADRAELEQALKTGHTVYVHGRGHVRVVRDLPPQREDGPAVEGVVMRTPDGRLTRAGMEQVVRAGGGVLHNGAVIDKFDELPTEEEIVAGDAQREYALANDIDAQMAALQARRDKLSVGKGKGKHAGDAPAMPRGPMHSDTQVVAAPPPPPETPAPEEDEGARRRRHRREE